MEELLQNILSLRNDISNLTELGNQNAYEYAELGTKIADTEVTVSNMNSKQSYLEKSIMGFKFKKSLLFTGPIGIISTGSYFAYLVITCWGKLTISSAFLAIVGTPTFGMAIAYYISTFLAPSKIFNNFLIRKYQSLKEMNNQLNNLIIKIRITKNNLMKMKNRKEEMYNNIMNKNEILESKREQLNKLEETYFNSLNVNNNFSVQNNTVQNSSKRRIRVLEDKNLEN